MQDRRNNVCFKNQQKYHFLFVLKDHGECGIKKSGI